MEGAHPGLFVIYMDMALADAESGSPNQIARSTPNQGDQVLVKTLTSPNEQPQPSPAIAKATDIV